MTYRSVLAIIQARLGSTRFPRKVLADINGQAMITHVVKRVMAVPSIGRIVVATPWQDKGEIRSALEPLCGRCAVMSTYDEEWDVLSRFAEIAAAHDEQHVARVTGDCPLFDPEIAERVIQAYLSSSVGYASNVPADGTECEVFHQSTLARANRLCSSQDDREHVTPWMLRQASILHVQTDVPDWMRSVNTEEDLEHVRKVLPCYV